MKFIPQMEAVKVCGIKRKQVEEKSETRSDEDDDEVHKVPQAKKTKKGKQSSNSMQ